MSDYILSLVPQHGAWIIMVATFLSCLAAPVPTSLMMLGGGAFVASGDMSLWAVAGAAWIGAILGDQTGYLIGEKGGAPLVARMARSPRRAPLIARAQALLHRWGGVSVFLSRWLLSPLGPYMNFIAGAGRLAWRRFTLWSVLGEAVWVSIYVLLGVAFADQIFIVAEMAADSVGFLAGAVVTLLLGMALFRRAPHRRARRVAATVGDPPPPPPPDS